MLLMGFWLGRAQECPSPLAFSKGSWGPSLSWASFVLSLPINFHVLFSVSSHHSLNSALPMFKAILDHVAAVENKTGPVYASLGTCILEEGRHSTTKWLLKNTILCFMLLNTFHVQIKSMLWQHIKHYKRFLKKKFILVPIPFSLW